MTLASKIVSSSTRPSTTNDKENLPSIDKQHRPITAAIPPIINDHLVVNGTTTNGVNNSLLTSSSIDTSTANNNQHLLLKTSTSGGPPVSSMTTSSRTSTADKIRSQTVRLPGPGVRRRETLDPVPGVPSIRKVDLNEKSKTPTGEAYVFYFRLFAWFVVIVCVCFLSTIFESRIPRLPQRFVVVFFLYLKKKISHRGGFYLVLIVVVLNHHYRLILLHKHHIISYVHQYVRIPNRQVYQLNNKISNFKRNSSVYFFFIIIIP